MDRQTAGWVNGFIGVAIFSASLPATRTAVADFPPVFLTSARAVIAACIGALFIAALGARRPARGDLLPLGVVALGVVIGFPLLTALALQHITAARSVVFIGLLPLATAIFAVIRAGERPRPAFWLFSILGAATVAGFAVMRGGEGAGDTLGGDLMMLAAVAVCGLGYAEGASLSRRLGGWQVISWALILSLPLMVALAVINRPATLAGIAPAAWLALGYVSVFSMMAGFVFWYRGLALGGIARVGQLQLLQPFMGLALAAMLLGEPVTPAMIASTVVVILCVFGARRFG